MDNQQYESHRIAGAFSGLVIFGFLIGGWLAAKFDSLVPVLLGGIAGIVIGALIGGPEKKKPRPPSEEQIQQVLYEGLKQAYIARSASNPDPAAMDRIIAETAAKLGEPIAMHNLGVKYYRGDGVPQDFACAVKCYQKAAELGLAASQVNLGMCYAKGEGVPQDYAMAVRWFREAANQNDPGGSFKLGVMYANGWGVPQDHKEAWRLVDFAARNGNQEALHSREDFAKRAVFAQMGR